MRSSAMEFEAILLHCEESGALEGDGIASAGWRQVMGLTSKSLLRPFIFTAYTEY